jgi:hypothetical protein
MKPARGKLRTREHVLAELGINHVEHQVLLCGFSIDRVQHDYGYDLTRATYSATGEFEPLSIRAIARCKNAIHHQIRGRSPKNV